MEVPPDLAVALKRTKGAAKHFEGFSPSARKGYLHWISQAVRPETRAARIAEVARLAAANTRNRFVAETAAPASNTTKKSTTMKSTSKKSTAKKTAAKRSTARKAAPSERTSKRKPR
jgi:hypothetical protein